MRQELEREVIRLERLHSLILIKTNWVYVESELKLVWITHITLRNFSLFQSTMNMQTNQIECWPIKEKKKKVKEQLSQ